MNHPPTEKPMISSFILRGSAILGIALSSFVAAQDETSVVFTVGGVSKSIPIEKLTFANNKFTVKDPGDKFPAVPLDLAWASHVSGVEPPQIAEAVGLLLMNKPSDAVTLLDPILEKHQITAKVPGNYWIRAARAALVAHSINRATSVAGDDPSVALSNAMLTPLSVKIDDRIAALEALANDGSPPEVSAYACFFRGNLLKTARKDALALDSYLSIPGRFPTCGRVIVAAAELNAGELLAKLNRRPEAVLCLEDAIREGKGTAISAEAEKRIPQIR
jgi:hypothetical protein